MNLELIRQYAPLISAFAASGSFIIWSVYALLFYSEFRRRRAAHIFIHAAGDGGPGTECLIINLSSEPVHILCSLASCSGSSVQVQAPADQTSSIQARVKQGPLETGEFLSLGRFDYLVEEIENVGDGFDRQDGQEQRLEVKVAAIHGLSNRPIGAVRGFLYDLESSQVVPDMAHTKQKRSRRDSMQVRHWMEECESYRESVRGKR